MKFLLWERRHCADPTDQRHYKGGGGGPSNSNSPTTTNTDRRMAVGDGGVAVTEGSSYSSWGLDASSAYTDNTRAYDDHSVTYAADAQVLQTLAENMPDAVRAMADAGADVINRAGGAVVNLNKDSVTANSRSFDSVVDFGAQAIDRLIDASVKTTETGTALASQAVQSFTPTENKNADAMKWGLIAAAGAVALVILGKNK
jgi:hypothetical protein